jgi:hypothetical protein
MKDEVFVSKHGEGDFVSKVAKQFSGGSLPWGRAEDAWEPVALYRYLLSLADDDSVTIASIGFFGNVCLSKLRE